MPPFWRPCTPRLSPGWSASFIRDRLPGPACSLLCGRSGFVLARAAGGEAEILTLAVTPESRRGGIGRALCAKLRLMRKTWERGHCFWKWPKTIAAGQKLYAGLGFKPVGQRKDYYDGQDARS